MICMRCGGNHPIFECALQRLEDDRERERRRSNDYNSYSTDRSNVGSGSSNSDTDWSGLGAGLTYLSAAIVYATVVLPYQGIKKAYDVFGPPSKLNWLKASATLGGIYASIASVYMIQDHYAHIYPAIAVYHDDNLNFSIEFSPDESQAENWAMSRCTNGMFADPCEHVVTLPSKSPVCIAISKSALYESKNYTSQVFYSLKEENLSKKRAECIDSSLRGKGACVMGPIEYYCNSYAWHDEIEKKQANDQKATQAEKKYWQEYAVRKEHLEAAEHEKKEREMEIADIAAEKNNMGYTMLFSTYATATPQVITSDILILEGACVKKDRSVKAPEHALVSTYNNKGDYQHGWVPKIGLSPMPNCSL